MLYEARGYAQQLGKAAGLALYLSNPEKWVQVLWLGFLVGWNWRLYSTFEQNCDLALWLKQAVGCVHWLLGISGHVLSGKGLEVKLSSWL